MNNMKIVVAPDSFKGCLTAREAAEALRDGLSSVDPSAEIVLVPMADGGEGTVQSLVDATHGVILTETVEDPLGRPISARYGMLGDERTAVIEMAEASGLPLLKDDERNPLVTSTYGTGQLIRSALDRGVKRLIIGIGGSATNDGGSGMAQALGARLLDMSGDQIPRGGGGLERLDRIDLSGIDPRVAATDVVVACDVTNPLTGPTGASAVYGPQKGATPEMVEVLDRNLRRYAEVIRRDLGVDVEKVPGAGAAGGLGAGLMAFVGARLQRGVDIVVESVGLHEVMDGADLVITGEGRLDSQTPNGKTPMGVASVALRRGIPVIGVAGYVSEDSDVLYELGFDVLIGIGDRPLTLEQSMAEARTLLHRTGARIMRFVQLGAKSFRSGL